MTDEAVLMRQSIVRAAVVDGAASGPHPLDGLHLVFRLENSEGWGPYSIFDDMGTDPGTRWGVLALDNFKRCLWTWGGHCFDNEGFDVVAYLALGLTALGEEVVFHRDRSVRIGAVARGHLTTEHGYVAPAGVLRDEN